MKWMEVFLFKKKIFQKAKKIVKKYFSNLLFHSYNSAALFRGKILKMNIVELGLFNLDMGIQI